MRLFYHSIVFACAFSVLIVSACTEEVDVSYVDSQEKVYKSDSLESISIMNWECNNITVSIPDKGLYDGISINQKVSDNLKEWALIFEHTSHPTVQTKDIIFLTLEEVSEITNIILSTGECVGLDGKNKKILSGDQVMLIIDLWLVEDLYKSALNGTRSFTETMNGTMVIGQNTYPGVTKSVRKLKFDNQICSLIKSSGKLQCSIKNCLDSLTTKSQEICTDKWFSAVRPIYNDVVKDLPMRDVCKVDNCGLEKHSKFMIEITVN